METNETRMEALDLNQQGITLMKVGNVEAAIQKYNRAIDIDPMVMESYKNLGDLYLATDEYQEAKNYYKKALLIEKSGEVYFQYGNACFMNDEPHEGLDYYNRALTAGYDSDEMLFFMGMAYEHMNDDKMALRYVQKAIIKNPSRPDYKVKKISILLRCNMMDEAKSEVDELLLNDPELYDGYHIKTSILIEEKLYDEAVEFSKMASEKFPEDADLFYDYGKAIALSGKYEDALKKMEQAKQLKYYAPSKDKFALLEAEINAELGKIDEAIAKCQECIDLEEQDDFNVEARFMLINLFLVKPDFEGALQQSVAIADKNVENSYYFAALYFRPFCLMKLDKQEEALHYYKEAISLYRLATLENPDAFDAYLYRVMCLRDVKQYDEALELLEFMEQLSNEVAEIYTIRADIYKLTNQTSLMKKELEKAFQLKPELRDTLGEGGE